MSTIKDLQVENQYSVQWALDMAAKTEVPYAAMCLYRKRDEVLRQISHMEDVHKGYQSKETRLQLQTFHSMARELERGAEILIIGI